MDIEYQVQVAIRLGVPGAEKTGELEGLVSMSARMMEEARVHREQEIVP